MNADQVAIVLDDARLDAPVEVGRLSRDRRGSTEVVRFAYSEPWLARVRDAFPLDPELPLGPGDFFSTAKSGLFGVFRDTSPDRWGRVLMERREALEARHEGRRPRQLGEWDFLLGVSDITRIGAVRLREVGGEGSFLDHRLLGAPPAARLRELQAIALALDEPGSEERPEYEAWLRQLLASGTSLGGARPKATFSATDGTLWIAKFPGRQDRYDVGAWEFLAHQLAGRAQIRVPEAQLMKLGGEHHTFAVQRFDRQADRRRLYASAMTLAVRDDGDAASYLDIAQALQDHGDPHTIAPDLAELYRRAAFNVLIGNRDDHLRNHGFLRDRLGWRLAPAFDVNPNPDKHEHALALDGSAGIPSITALRATRELYRLSESQAARIEQAVRQAFEDWRAIARSVGIPRREIDRLAAVIDPSLE
ncbi:MAG: type II toxin-antitoxin system HipA family toxin [Polyangiaceae bacterium]|nr:type II toxin-antitoxin system HipA family toxin [Polyangiaceae bacterium]